MTEATVCTRIVNTILSRGYYAFKIPDDTGSRAHGFKRPRGFDIFAFLPGDGVAIEVKINESLPKKVHTYYKMFTESQVKALTQIVESGTGEAWTMLCVYRFARLAKDRRHDLYVIPWAWVMRGIWPPPHHLMRCKFSKGQYLIKNWLDTFPRF